MNNSDFNSELYAEMLQDEGIQYDEEVKQEIFDYMIFEQ